jgi:hypothetical protein
MQKETPVTNPAPGTLAWFEVATGDLDGAEFGVFSPPAG